MIDAKGEPKEAVVVQHIEPDRYAIEITSDGQSIRYEAPSAEEVVRLMNMDKSKEP